MPSPDALALVECLREPAFLLETTGRIVATNRSARALVGQGADGKDLMEFLVDPPCAFPGYLRRCSGTTEGLPGAATFLRPDGSELRLKTYGGRLRGDATLAPRILLRLSSTEFDGFSVLSSQVRSLNAEVHRRRRAQAALEEALRRNETLFKELQHRVKNNVQMLLSLFSAAKRETSHDEVKEFLDEMASRLTAVVTAQQLMYRSQEMEAVEASSFVSGLCEAIGRSQTQEAQILVTAFEGQIANDVVFPLALILNELLTNAHKHAFRGKDSLITVDLHHDGVQYELVVKDNGPGFKLGTGERRSSGLGLVRGLCRQIGGSLTVEDVGGARCIVSFTGPGA